MFDFDSRTDEQQKLGRGQRAKGLVGPVTESRGL